MPELPEVETIKNDLAKKILNKTISKIEIINSGTIKNSKKLFLKKIEKNKFTKIDRIGKLLIFNLPNNIFLLIHLKMTGQLVYQKRKIIINGGHEDKRSQKTDKLPNKHTRIIFTFSDKGKLFFNDLRKFGYLKIVNKKELEIIKQNFGIEPLQKNFTLNSFINSLQNKKTNIKATLLNQKNIAGIGNIYVDEILFASKIMPERKADSLSQQEIKTIFTHTQRIIKKAIKWRGTTFSDYIDSQGKPGNFSQFLQVYGRQNKKCYICGNNIKKIKLAGRGTHFCANCQKK